MIVSPKRVKGEFTGEERLWMLITKSPHLLSLSLLAYGKLVNDYKLWVLAAIFLILGFLLSSYIGFTKKFYFPATSFQYPVKGNRAKWYAAVDLILALLLLILIIFLIMKYNFLQRIEFF